MRLKIRGAKTFEFEGQGKCNLFSLLGNMYVSSVAPEGQYKMKINTYTSRQNKKNLNIFILFKSFHPPGS